MADKTGTKRDSAEMVRRRRARRVDSTGALWTVESTKPTVGGFNHE